VSIVNDTPLTYSYESNIYNGGYESWPVSASMTLNEKVDLSLPETSFFEITLSIPAYYITSYTIAFYGKK
jgi:hypothetical protein